MNNQSQLKKYTWADMKSVSLWLMSRVCTWTCMIIIGLI